MSVEDRPTNCRNRLRDEGKLYPKSGCEHCETGGLTGCPFGQLKTVVPKPQSCCSHWRNDAIENAAVIAERYGNGFLAQDIRSMKNTTSTKPQHITDLLAKYHNLERVNKEWETLWKPIDGLVRPLTPLGESVGEKAVELIKDCLERGIK